ncbi:MAG: hypothetical protein ACREOG_20280 [Gemmatimonadaceae bacterium]
MTHLTNELLDAAASGETIAPSDTEHLRVCAECRAQVARLRSLRAQLAALPRSIEPASDSWPQLRDAIRERRARRRTLASAAAFALAAAVLVAVVRIGTPRDSETPAPAMNELAELRGVVAPIVVDAMAANLTVYDNALQELEAHATVERENPDLRQRIEDLRRKRAALLRLASNS